MSRCVTVKVVWWRVSPIWGQRVGSPGIVGMPLLLWVSLGGIGDRLISGSLTIFRIRSPGLAVLDQRGVIAVRHGLRALVLVPRADDKDLTTVHRQVTTITDRQKQIVAQVDSLGYAVRHVRQRVHELARLVHQLD